MRPQGSWLTPALGATALRMPYQEVACASPAASRVVVMDWAAPTAGLRTFWYFSTGMVLCGNLVLNVRL